MKLNIGAGESKLEGYTNIDLEESVKSDLVHDIRKAPLPYSDGSIEEICMFHCIEHIELKFWPQIFYDFSRLLIPDGKLLLAYPEFTKCALNYINNHLGMRVFWRNTIYGRQLYPGDYHVTPVNTMELIELLREHGFDNFKFHPEVNEDYNTFLMCQKGIKPLSVEEVVNEEIFK